MNFLSTEEKNEINLKITQDKIKKKIGITLDNMMNLPEIVPETGSDENLSKPYSTTHLSSKS